MSVANTQHGRQGKWWASIPGCVPSPYQLAVLCAFQQRSCMACFNMRPAQQLGSEGCLHKLMWHVQSRSVLAIHGGHQ